MNKNASYFIVLVSAIATLTIGLKSLSSPYTLTSIGFIVWAISPYGYLTLLTKLVTSKAATIAIFVIALIVGIVGLSLLIDVMFIHTDAQGGLAYVFVPVFQWAGLLLLSLPLFMLNQSKNA